jgi:acetyl esterase/lipase
MLTTKSVGGGYFAALPAFMLDFWRYVQVRLETLRTRVGSRVCRIELLYVSPSLSSFPFVSPNQTALYPESTYPTQLHQACTALDHLISTGTHPSNIHIIGDSAGGNLVLGLLSLLLHPLPFTDSEPPPRIINSPLPAPLAGVYLMSPWVNFTNTSPSLAQNAPHDISDSPALQGLGERVIGSRTPPSQRAYVEPLKAPSGWFDGLDSVVDRVLVSAGDKEVDRDDVVSFGKVHLEGKTRGYEFVLQEGGVHDDPYFDFFLGTPGEGEVGG